MYNEKIESLINLALADGDLTEKEKQILFKKAEAAGIDLDEFEMVLQAKLFEKQKSDMTVSVAPKSDKLGDVRKCPACGAIAETFATKCSDCGTEFRNIQASQNIIKFFEKLDDIESKRIENIYENKTSEDSIGFGKWLFFWYIILPLKIINFFIDKAR
jgi:DNA-directed RNA polymerase subunit RPC12/RpoP